jgi:GrpB-like predicted nucleotidyltransferase (UPF0157 family)
MPMSRGQPGPAPNDAERIVADAWHRVLRLVDRLNEQPIDAATYREVRTYLASDAFDAVEAYERVTAGGVAALLARVDELNRARPGLAVVERRESDRETEA